MSSSPDALVIGLNAEGKPLSASVSDTARLNNPVEKLWESARAKNKAGESRVFYSATPSGQIVAAVSLGGKSDTPGSKAEPSDYEKLESTRRAAAIGAQALNGVGAKTIAVDTLYSPHAAAVGSRLALYKYDLLKTPEGSGIDAAELSRNSKPELLPLTKQGDASVQVKDAVQGGVPQLSWETGEIYAQAQNLARELMETPANIMTPTAFCERAKKEFQGLENVEIFVRDEAWATEKGMRTFLSVTRGTDEPAKFLEIHYKGAPNKDSKPLAFVGKGITFDSGGISLKPGKDMKLMRGDMGGAASVVSAAWAIAKLQIPINLVTTTPLAENLPSGKATKPGDVIVAMNGKTVEVDNTDAEGRLVLADALYYTSSVYKPHTIIDAATLTGAMVIALGSVYTGTFCTEDSLWGELEEAGKAEHDRFWRMPLCDDYLPLISGSNADLCNTGGPTSGSCTAAIFLKAFVDGLEAKEGEVPVRYAHLDIAGAMEVTQPSAYNVKGMSGRPVRALVEFARRSASTSKA